MTDAPNPPPAQSDKPSDDLSASSSTPSAAQRPVTAADAENPSLPEPTSVSPTDARSPPADTSSSLSPPPDATTPSHAMDAPDDPPGQPPALGGAGDVQKSGEHNAAADEVERASRQSTPLSELSSAPDTAPDDEPANGDGQASTADGDAAKAKSAGEDAVPPSAAGNVSLSGAVASASTKDGLSASQQQQQQNSSSLAAQAPSSTNPDGSMAARGDQNTDFTMVPKMALGQQHGQSSLPDGTPSSHTPTKPSSHDPKVVSILELNSLLLRSVDVMSWLSYVANGAPEYLWSTKREEYQCPSQASISALQYNIGLYQAFTISYL